MTTISTQLRTAIRDSGLTHYAIAAGAGIPPHSIAMIGRFMAGAGLSLATADKLCKFLDLRLAKNKSKKAKEKVCNV